MITSTQVMAWALGTLPELRVGRIFLGGHVREPDQLPIKSLSMELSSLAQWTGHDPIKREFPEVDGKPIGLNVSFRYPDPIEVNLPSAGCSIDISHRCEGPSVSRAGRTLSIHFDAQLAIRPHAEMTLGVAIGLSWQFQNLLALLIGYPVSVRAVAFSPSQSDDDGVGESPDSTIGPIHVVYHQRGRHDYPDRDTCDMLLPFPDIKDEYARIVETWFTGSEAAVLASYVFFGAQLLEAPQLNERFLSVSQAAESYHRASGKGVYMKQEEYESIIPRVMELLPQEIGGDHRSALKSKLKYGNEYSLRKRLKSLLERVPKDVQHSIAGDTHKFVDRVTATRNYFTHYDPENENGALKGEIAYVVAERLRILIAANMLMDLGIRGDKLLSTLRRNKHYEYWMAQELKL